MEERSMLRRTLFPEALVRLNSYPAWIRKIADNVSANETYGYLTKVIVSCDHSDIAALGNKYGTGFYDTHCVLDVVKLRRQYGFGWVKPDHSQSKEVLIG